MVGCSRTTTPGLLREPGEACRDAQDRLFRDLPCRKLQLAEMSRFCQARKADVPEEKRGTSGYGDVWAWTAMHLALDIT